MAVGIAMLMIPMAGSGIDGGVLNRGDCWTFELLIPLDGLGLLG